MADNRIPPPLPGVNTNRFKEAVCMDTERIFDSCSDKDCLEDLQVFFTEQGQRIVDCSTLIKCKSAEVLDVYLTVEPIHFNKGFYSVDITFYFRVHFSTYCTPTCASVDLTGLAFYCKKVILFGSEGGVKTFRSDRCDSISNCGLQLPTASLKIAEPICLGSRIVDCSPTFSERLSNIPEEVSEGFDGELQGQSSGSKTALVTLGIFTIVNLQRDVQLMVPAYDYCVPEKDCVTSISAEDPCEMFKRIKFPVDEFFPETLCELTEEA